MRVNATLPASFWVALGLMSAAISTAAQSETYLNPLGGPGGSPFSRRCPPGEALHGFELRAADDVDAIRPICFRTGGPGQSISPGMYAGEWHGGSGGRIGRVNCPVNQQISAVVGMIVASEGRTEVVNEIVLFCGLVSSNTFEPSTPGAIFEGPRYKGTASPGRPTYNRQSQQCPKGAIAVGVHGRTGVWVDAIGLICAAPEPDRGFAELARRPPPVALGRVHPTAPPPVPLGRKQPTSSSPDPLERKGIPMSVILAPPPICVAAQNARGRNSPAAPGLERQCQIAMEQAAARARTAPPPAPPPVIAAPAPMPPPVGYPPAPLPPPVGYPPAPGPWQPYSVCDEAREARYNNSPDAYALESRCRAEGGGYPGPDANAPDSAGSWQPSPLCHAARDARYNNSPDADRLEALCRAGSDVWGQPGRRVPLSYGERSEILDLHNRLRPDFQRLQWDVGLEDSAARWASQMAAYGQMMPDSTLRGALGENLFMAPSGRYTFGDVGRIWASERASFRPGIYPNVTGYGSSAQVTNYTQMIWPDTTHVGCAVERAPRADFFVCRYSPAGNIYGRPVR